MPVPFPILMPNGAIQDQDCLTVAELAAELRTTRDAVYRKIHAGEWPYLKPVRRVYFSPEHVRTILAMSEHRPEGMPPQLRQMAGDA
jgi:excisionase family DNA binding protein